MSTAAGVDILWVLRLIDSLCHRRFQAGSRYRLSIAQQSRRTQPFSLRLFSARSIAHESEGSATVFRFASKARHGSLLLDTFSRWIAYAAKQDANAMAVRWLVFGGSSSYTSNTTISGIVSCHDHHILSMFERWSNTSRCERQKPMAIRMGELPT
jgi:hypothetical protein